MKQTTEEPLSSLFRRILKSIDTGSGDTEALRNQFRNRFQALGNSGNSKPVAMLPDNVDDLIALGKKLDARTSKNETSHNSKELKEIPKKVTPKVKTKTSKTTSSSKVKLFAKKLKSDIFDRIQMQRLQRTNETEIETVHPMANFKASGQSKKEDIADRVKRQRAARKKPRKNPTGAEGKDPKKVTSKKPHRFN